MNVYVHFYQKKVVWSGKIGQTGSQVGAPHPSHACQCKMFSSCMTHSPCSSESDSSIALNVSIIARRWFILQQSLSHMDKSEQEYNCLCCSSTSRYVYQLTDMSAAKCLLIAAEHHLDYATHANVKGI